MNLTFKAEREYILNKLEYEALWNTYGQKIQRAFENVTGLPFKEKNIEGIVGNFQSNFAGVSLGDAMLFRFSVRHKLGTILHELSHRFLLEYNFQYNGIVDNDHELIDLFLYDVIEEAFGKSAAEERVKYELTFPEEEIPEAWNKILNLPKQQRKSLWTSIIERTR